MVGMIIQSRLFGRRLRVLTRLKTREIRVSKPRQKFVTRGGLVGWLTRSG